ncbi:hypothetical protein CEQ90_11605 [Lewinellaceae bacterium SD302]|nr:hypothetical protein CEQ90_11605 [Lewinellaceae bacterium SD302]
MPNSQQSIFRLFSFLLLLSILPTTSFANNAEPPELPAKSKITAVTVYLQGAQVNRTAKVNIPAGRNTFVFTGLTAKADPLSVQFSLNEPGVNVLSVSHRINYDEKAQEDDRDRQIRKSLKILETRERRLQTEAAIGKEEEAILKANRNFGGEQNGLDPTQLEQAVAYHRQRLTDIRMNYLVIQDSLAAINDRRKDLLRQLSERGLERQRPATGEIVVEVESKTAVTTEVGLAYLVPDASWEPTYDVRVDDISRPIDLRYRARVNQQSGEDWEQVKITLSTGDPRLSASAPELPVWRLGNGTRPPTYVPTTAKKTQYGFKEVTGVVTDGDNNEALIGASVLVEGMEIGTITDINGNFTLQVPTDRQKLEISYVGYDTQVILIKPGQVQDIRMNEGTTLDEVVVTGRSAGAVRSNMVQRRRESRTPPPPPPVPVQVERRATTVAFVIELPYDVPSDGESRTVEVRNYSVPATFQHFAVPKLQPEVYLTAAVANWEHYDLISGELQLFFEGTYLGSSQLDVSNTSDTLTLSLGRDPGVIISRKTDESVNKRGGFFAGKANQSRAYLIEVRNSKAQPVNLLVTDQIPVAANKEVDVEAEVPKTADYNERTGLLKWSLDLPPGGSEKLRFSYEVKYPKDYRIRLD